MSLRILSSHGYQKIAPANFAKLTQQDQVILLFVSDVIQNQELLRWGLRSRIRFGIKVFRTLGTMLTLSFCLVNIVILMPHAVLVFQVLNVVLNFILIVKFEKFWPDESPFLTLDAWRNGMGSQVLRYAHISLCLEVISQYESLLVG